MSSPRLTALVEEQMRRFSAGATQQIALRYGGRFPMWIGCGYPKSGTVWLCRLMSSYLGVPFPQSYVLPIAMRSVIHAHWQYNSHLPVTAYIQRDGRDVMTSLYFHNMRAISNSRNPRNAERLSIAYLKLFGSGFDPENARENLPRFIETEMQSPSSVRMNWPRHVKDWNDGSRPQVSHVTYEALVDDTAAELTSLMERLTGERADPLRVQMAVERFDFKHTSGRSTGDEDRTSFLRKGTHGDWRNYFTREAGEIFDFYAGDVLQRTKYTADRHWYDDLPTI